MLLARCVTLRDGLPKPDPGPRLPLPPCLPCVLPQRTQGVVSEQQVLWANFLTQTALCFCLTSKFEYYRMGTLKHLGSRELGAVFALAAGVNWAANIVQQASFLGPSCSALGLGEGPFWGSSHQLAASSLPVPVPMCPAAEHPSPGCTSGGCLPAR